MAVLAFEENVRQVNSDLVQESPNRRTSPHRVREIVTALNRADLKSLDYAYLVKQISELIGGIEITVSTAVPGTILYRGVKHKEKPTEIGFLGYPPENLVVNYQRCNPPGRAMFYCNTGIASVLSEIDAQPGDKVYLSTWVIVDEFFFARIPPNASETIKSDAAFAKIETFFETRFSQPIHEIFSEQYKITAAISEKFTACPVVGDPLILKNRVLGALAYPSVANISRSDNLAIRPSVVDRCFRLTDVREIEIFSKDGDSRIVRETDFSSTFDNGRINWAGRAGQWYLGGGEMVFVTVDNGQWIARPVDMGI